MDEKCFAMNKAGSCGVLSATKCPGYAQCSFYKPRWRFQKGVEQANVRLRTLPPAQQFYIAEKYYDGQMPWRRGVKV